MKKCTKCGIGKQVSEFYTYKNKPRPECKDCHKKVARVRALEWARLNPEENRLKSKVWREANPDKAKCGQLRINFGITLEQFNEKLSKQDNRCAICRVEHTPGDKAFAQDHCHSTGKLRGILCGTCNTSLGGFRDSKTLLNNAIRYLEEHND